MPGLERGWGRMRARVLVTTARWQSALCCVESLGGAGHEVHVMSSARLAPATASRRCARRIPAPPESDREAWDRALMAAVEAGRYDLVVPISDLAVDAVDARREAILARAGMPLAASPALETARDKAATTRLALELGLAVPRTIFPGTREEALAAARELGFPCVLKRPRSFSSQGVLVARTPDEVAGFLDRGDDPGGSASGAPFLQAFEPGELLDVATVCDRGRIARGFAFTVAPGHLTGGAPPFATTARPGAAWEAAARLVAALGWHGAVDFDFIRTPDGRDVLLEINPRLSGTSGMGLRLGVDLPGALLDLAQGREVAPQAPVPEGVRVAMGVELELQWLALDAARRWREALASRFDRGLVRPRRWGDPALVAAQAAIGAYTLARALRR